MLFYREFNSLSNGTKLLFQRLIHFRIMGENSTQVVVVHSPSLTIRGLK